MQIENRKILLFDWTNLAKRTCFSSHCKISDTEIDYQVFNFSMWNSVYSACLKHKASSAILASDNNSWRKLIYAPYKLNRRLDAKKKAESGEPSIDWNVFFENLNEFSNKIKMSLPFIYLSEKNCEADDIIGVLAKTLSVKNEVIIISGDQDYKQCLKHNNVKLWDPGGFNKKPGFSKLECDTNDWINALSLHGQNKDNIYNVYTKIDFPIDININRESKDILPIRKPSFPEKKAWDIIKSNSLEKWLTEIGPEEARKKNKLIEKENIQRNIDNLHPKVLYEENVSDRFKINKQLISFDAIPSTLSNRIINQLNDYNFCQDGDLYTFFKEMKWNKPLDEFSKVESFLYNLY